MDRLRPAMLIVALVVDVGRRLPRRGGSVVPPSARLIRVSAQKLQEFQQAMAAIDPANLSFTWNVCNRAAVFLNVNVYKGAFWAATSRLDTSAV